MKPGDPSSLVQRQLDAYNAKNVVRLGSAATRTMLNSSTCTASVWRKDLLN